MNALENRIKGLEQHIEKLYKTIEGWEKLVKEKDEIIKKYEAQVKNNVGLANVVDSEAELCGKRDCSRPKLDGNVYCSYHDEINFG